MFVKVTVTNVWRQAGGILTENGYGYGLAAWQSVHYMNHKPYKLMPSVRMLCVERNIMILHGKIDSGVVIGYSDKVNELTYLST